jgi:thioredoxin reductase (NADPH)
MARGKFGPSMSDYLNQRIAATPNIVVHENSRITALNGDTNISAADILTNGKKGSLPIRAVFVFIGADPGCEWLPKSVKRDEKGFVLTGSEVVASGHWPLTDRTPCPLETSAPGLLAAGDIRSGSTKRVGFAVGDGSLAITCVHHLMAKG